jgi:hypothetical protein
VVAEARLDSLVMGEGGARSCDTLGSRCVDCGRLCDVQGEWVGRGAWALLALNRKGRREEMRIRLYRWQRAREPLRQGDLSRRTLRAFYASIGLGLKLAAPAVPRHTASSQDNTPPARPDFVSPGIRRHHPTRVMFVRGFPAETRGSTTMARQGGCAAKPVRYATCFATYYGRALARVPDDRVDPPKRLQAPITVAFRFSWRGTFSLPTPSQQPVVIWDHEDVGARRRQELGVDLASIGGSSSDGLWGVVAPR